MGRGGASLTKAKDKKTACRSRSPPATRRLPSATMHVRAGGCGWACAVAVAAAVVLVVARCGRHAGPCACR